LRVWPWLLLWVWPWLWVWRFAVVAGASFMPWPLPCVQQSSYELQTQAMQRRGLRFLQASGMCRWPYLHRLRSGCGRLSAPLQDGATCGQVAGECLGWLVRSYQITPWFLLDSGTPSNSGGVVETSVHWTQCALLWKPNGLLWRLLSKNDSVLFRIF